MARKGDSDSIVTALSGGLAVQTVRKHSVGERKLAIRCVSGHTFCPRSAWLEYVEGLSADNEHTVHGSFVHRRVDKPGGALGVEEGRTWHARALWLSDDELALSGKLDIVEPSAGGAVFPVDTKKGRSDNGDLWPQDRVQLTLQGLLLERHGFRVEKIAAWYNGERRRVEENLTSSLREFALNELSATRVTLTAAEAPSPLEDSPKCFGCSLNELCLPDEIRRLGVLRDLIEDESSESILRGSHEEDVSDKLPLRRIQPPRFDTIPLYVDSAAVLVRLKGEEIRVEDREGKLLRSVGISTVSHVNIYGNANITTPLLRELLDRDVPVCFFSSGGWYRGRTVPSMNRQVHIRVRQHEAAAGEEGLVIARRLIADKIHNSLVLLRRNLPKNDASNSVAALKYARKAVETCESFESLLGLEGNAARVYWEAFSRVVSQSSEEFVMKGRTRRPPRDRTNALLSYAYGMLTKDVALAVEMAGFDPYAGFFHTNHHGRPSLALDMMEPFRALIADSVVMTVIRKREVVDDDFILAGVQVSMKPGARKAVMRAYERRMDELVIHPLFGYAVSYRRILYIQARLLGRFLIGEIDAPPSFRSR